MAERLARRVLLIGWDAADWKLISPLLDQGLMPTLDSFLNEGVMGSLATLEPVLSPMLWNSIATGKRAWQHGICGFMEPDPQTGGVRPVSSVSRRVKALWNICTQQGLRSVVVGWFAGHPAEPILGACVSPMYAVATKPHGETWPLAEGAVHPEFLREPLAELRLHPGDLPPAAWLPFVPRAAEIEPGKDRRLYQVVKTLAECCSIHNAATWLLERESWEFAAVYYNAIDHFCHIGMQFHPPRMEGVSEREFELYRDIVTSAYRFHDMLLERLLALAGPETAVLLVSDHGFHSDHLRPRHTPRAPAGPAVWHRGHGVVAMRGPGIRRDERIYGATLLDIAPTALTMLGLPVGADMPGRTLAAAFEQPPAVTAIPSWEEEPGACGMHPADLRMDPETAQALCDQFVALGYLEAPPENAAKARESAVREARFNLARDYLDARMAAEAIPLLEQVLAEQPGRQPVAQHLAYAYYQSGRREDARRVLEEMLGGGKQPWADWLRGVLLFEEGRAGDALECLLRAEGAFAHSPRLHLWIGRVYLRQRRLAEARRAFDRAREADPDQAAALLGLAMVTYQERHYQEAASLALRAVGLQHYLPLGHLYLGVALARLRQFEPAAVAFETALAVRPGLRRAHQWLARIYELLDRPDEAREQRRLFRALIAAGPREPELPASER